jgi:acetate kinase
VLVDDDVLGELDELAALAPLHQPPALAALRATRAALPDVPAIACFDTAFHADMPPAASTYAIPARWRDELGIRRYGFHGLAHEWAAHRAATLAGSGLRTVVAHLGSGASACAVAWNGDQPRSVDITMGFTPTAGLVMASRSGDLDPAVPLWLVESAGLRPADVAAALDHESGLLGLAGTADMREVLAAEHAGHPAAGLAVEVWVHRLRAAIAAMAAALGGLDVLVFSGGVGERAPDLRRRTVAGLAFLGLTLDESANASADPDGESDVSADSAAARTLVVHTREGSDHCRPGARPAPGRRPHPQPWEGHDPDRMIRDEEGDVALLAFLTRWRRPRTSPPPSAVAYGAGAGVRVSSVPRERDGRS